MLWEANSLASVAPSASGFKDTIAFKETPSCSSSLLRHPCRVRLKAAAPLLRCPKGGHFDRLLRLPAIGAKTRGAVPRPPAPRECPDVAKPKTGKQNPPNRSSRPDLAQSVRAGRPTCSATLSSAVRTVLSDGRKRLKLAIDLTRAALPLAAGTPGGDRSGSRYRRP